MELKIAKEDREQVLVKLKSYFLDERDEEIGDLATGFLLDFITKEIGPFFYNCGIKDAKEQTLQAFSTLMEEIDCLEMLPPKKSSPK